jgi:hypothetical protein
VVYVVCWLSNCDACRFVSSFLFCFLSCRFLGCRLCSSIFGIRDATRYSNTQRDVRCDDDTAQGSFVGFPSSLALRPRRIKAIFQADLGSSRTFNSQSACAVLRSVRLQSFNVENSTTVEDVRGFYRGDKIPERGRQARRQGGHSSGHRPTNKSA